MALYGAAGASAQQKESQKLWETAQLLDVLKRVGSILRNLSSHLFCIDIGFLRFPWWLRSIIPRKSQILSQWGWSKFCFSLFVHPCLSGQASATKRQVWWSVCFWLLLSKPVRTLVHGQWRTLLTRNFEFQVGRICPRGKSRHALVMERWLNDFRMGKLVRLWLDGSVKDQRHAAGGFLSLASWICWSPGCSCIEKSSTKAFSFKSMLIPFVHF